MSGAPSQTGIINDALARLGSLDRISSIDGSQGVARHAKAVWDGAVRGLIADHPWNFAVRRVQLNAGPAPDFGYERSFALPADCLRWLPPAHEDGCGAWFEGVEERVDGHLSILTDAEAPLDVRYISAEALTDWARWPAYFVQAVTFAVAAGLAIAVTDSRTMHDRMADAAEQALRRAKRRDALETGNRSASSVTVKSNWLTARQVPYSSWGR